MKTLELKTSYGAEMVVKVFSNGLVKLTIYDADSDANSAILDKDQAIKLAHFILENVK